MIPFTITDDDIVRAELHLLTRLGATHAEQTNFMQDNIIGALGEIAVYNWINQWSPCYFSDRDCKYDLLLGDTRTVEVKTMRTSTTPQPHLCAQCLVNSGSTSKVLRCGSLFILTSL